MLIKILIPIYKPIPNEFERMSFYQCVKLLKNYHFTIVTHQNINITYYTNILIENNIDYSLEIFNSKFFTSIQGYNCLLLNKNFYLRFIDTEYIFIYQLDGFIFKDNLKFWINENYDYIGAPWFKNFGFHEKRNKLWDVGNGGVSLRKTSTFLHIFEQKLSLKTLPFFIKNLRKKGFFKGCINLIKMFFSMTFTPQIINYYLQNYIDLRINEDYFWSICFSNTNLALKKPNLKTAASFCFEKSPSYLYDLIGNELPFACHGWEKYEYEEFWKEKINGYSS